MPNKKIAKSLATTHPELALQASGWDPTTLTAGSNKKKEWVCQFKPDHKYEATVCNRSSGTGCPYCLNQKVLVGDNDLATTHPELALQASGWDPTTLTAGSHKKKEWVCQQNPNHRWEAVVNKRLIGTGCPSCASHGFDPNKEGYLYFIKNVDLDMLQIGITNVPEDRLRSHKSKGWEVLEVRGPMEGYSAKQWETAILIMLKDKGADLSNSKVAGNFDGYTEAWSRLTFEANSIFELMRLTEEFESRE